MLKVPVYKDTVFLHSSCPISMSSLLKKKKVPQTKQNIGRQKKYFVKDKDSEDAGIFMHLGTL